ncbi:MAG: DUF1501 domain-containing protein, partial [Verrucomicrobia bacterium]|nr:DUF1501 domain-containing protein [Verrucomicrobiota bacterium]
DRRRMLDQLLRQNNEEAQQSMDPEVIARIAQYEMAYRMQTAVPELTDFSQESQETLDMYGPYVKIPGSYAYNCLMSRRLAERGVRFVQLYHRGWDQHFNLPKEIRMQCEDTDQPQAALVKDLKRLGMLDDTLVIWGGEFGRTTYSQGVLTKENHGRDHHPRCFTMWFAGGGTKPGITYGKTDDYCRCPRPYRPRHPSVSLPKGLNDKKFDDIEGGDFAGIRGRRAIGFLQKSSREGG